MLMRLFPSLLLLALISFSPLPADGPTTPPPAFDPQASPWGLSTSAHSTYLHDAWFPRVSTIGVTWVRTFADWHRIEPQPGDWQWQAGDQLVAAAEKNHLQLCGLFGYTAPWAQRPDAKGTPFPMTHLDDWSQYVGKTAERYRDRVNHWEVWNEPNLGFKGRYPDGSWDTTRDYATLTVRAYDAAKAVAPSAQIGLTCASFDVPYLDCVIQAQKAMGKPDHFDFICIHPYEMLGGLSEPDGEIPYLWMNKLLRDMLQAESPAKGQADIWITELGRPIGDRKESKEIDRVTPEDSASSMIKAYVMSVAQGIRHVCWFEGQASPEESPNYGILDVHGQPRPAFIALKTLIHYLGETPTYIGWLAPGKDGRGYGFAFDGPQGPVIVEWMPHGQTTPFSANHAAALTELIPGSANHQTLTDIPVLITHPSADLIAAARTHAAQSFPWGGNFAGQSTVSIQLGPQNDNGGIIQVEHNWTQPHTFADGSTGAIVSPPGKHDDQNIKFITHPSFSSVMTRDYYICVTARRLASPQAAKSFAGMNLVYELADTRGGCPNNTTEWRSLDLNKDGWQTLTWHITDAAFSKMWGYDFAFSIGKSDPFVIGKVDVSLHPFAN